MRRALSSAPSVVFVLLALAAGRAGAAPEELNRIVLRVNDQVLTLHDYEERKAAELQGLVANPNLSAADRQARLAELDKALMQQIFQELLLLSRANQLSIRLGDSEIDEAVAGIMRDQGFASREELERALSQSGLTLARLRDNLRREMLYGQVVGKEVTQKVEVGEEELRAYYKNHPDQFKIDEERQLKETIVLDAAALSPAERARVAADIVARLDRGEDFEEIVAETRDQGITTGVIDLGWLRKAEVDPTLADVAWALDAGEHSAPIEGRGGLHVLQLAGLKEARLQAFSEVQEQILRRERSRRFERDLRTYLQKLEERSYVVENVPSEAVGFRASSGELAADDEIEAFRRPLEPAPAEAPPADAPPADAAGEASPPAGAGG